MNNVIQSMVKRLKPIYKDYSDVEIINDIRAGLSPGEALFYLLFGRYEEMLHSIFIEKSKPSMEFSDFMLELDIHLFSKDCAVINSYNENKASFKTYLSLIAHNLLHDLKKKEKPMLDVNSIENMVYKNNQDEIMMLVDAINRFPNTDSRYILFKTIEGYKSKEIAKMLTSKKHEEGTLEEDVELKSSYIDTLRSRALKEIRNNIYLAEKREEYYRTTPEILHEIGVCMDDIKIYKSHLHIYNLFVENIQELYKEYVNSSSWDNQ